MAHARIAAALSLVFLATACGSGAGSPGVVSQSRLRSVGPSPAAPAVRAGPSLVAATTPHSRAAATVLADAALDAVTFPAGSTRLATRPALGTADLDQEADLEIVSRVGRVRWWSVPGSVVDVAGYLTAHPPHGLQVSTQGTLYVWSAATPLSFDMDAYLVQDGSDVDVSLEAESTWTPAKTAIETIPSTVTSAVVDYTSHAFGSDRRFTVTGSALATIRDGINALQTRADQPASSCATSSQSWTVTMTYAGHAVVVSVDDNGCLPVTLTSDGSAQPLLWASQNHAAFSPMVEVVDRLASTVAERPGASAVPGPDRHPQGSCGTCL